MAPFSRPHWLTWSQEGGRQVEVLRREEAEAAAAAAAAAINKKNLCPWWQPQGAQPE